MKNIHLIATDGPSRLRINPSGNIILSSIESGSRGETYHIYITSDEDITEGDYGIDLDDNSLFKCKSKYGEEFTSELLKNGNLRGLSDYDNCKKIILTTNTYLIADGVQAIDDNFLEWFVKNPSCEFVEVVKEMYMPQSNGKISDGKITHELSLNTSDNTLPFYKIIIPQKESKYLNLKELESKLDKILDSETEESLNNWLNSKRNKQESLDEAAENYAKQFDYAEDSSPQIDFIAGAKYQSGKMYSEEEVDLLVNELINKFTNWSGSYVYRDKLIEIYEQFKKK
jgi:hypothetical protein